MGLGTRHSPGPDFGFARRIMVKTVLTFSALNPSKDQAGDNRRGRIRICAQKVFLPPQAKARATCLIATSYKTLPLRVN